MSDTYLELHNLESSLTEFAVARIIDETLQNSAECQLPTDNPVSLTLPNLAVELPDLVCNYDIDTPLVPLPHFCSPTFSSSVASLGCDNTVVDVDLAFSNDGECNYSLGGLISVCTTVPCSEGFNATGTVTAVTTGTADYVQLYGSVSLNQDGPCGFSLTGDLTLEENIPDLSHVCTTQDFDIEFESEEKPFEIVVIEDFKITIYPKLEFEVIEKTKCKIKYKITVNKTTAAVVENLEYKEIAYCVAGGGTEIRKFLCLAE